MTISAALRGQAGHGYGKILGNWKLYKCSLLFPPVISSWLKLIKYNPAKPLLRVIPLIQLHKDSEEQGDFR